MTGSIPHGVPSIHERNLLVAIRSVQTAQSNTKNPSMWQLYEDELIDLREKLLLINTDLYLQITGAKNNGPN